MRKEKSNLGSFLSRTLLAGSLAITPYVAKADVLVEPVDSVQTAPVARWERGRNYSVDVWTTNVGPQLVDGAQWKLNIPLGLQSYLTNTNWIRPLSEIDFFEGAPLFDQGYFQTGSTSYAIVFSGGSMPVGKTGSTETYGILVSPSTPLGNFDFTLTSTLFIDPNNNTIPRTITNNQQFRIMPRKGDMTGNGVGLDDIETFTNKLIGTDTSLAPGETYSGEYGDWAGNDDGVLDARDIQGFLENHIQNYGQ